MPAKPFLKWVGGKTQIIEKVMDKFPPIIMGNYIEPFLGGGSVLLAVLDRIKQTHTLCIQGEIYASDNNPALISLYQCLQNQIQMNTLFACLKSLVNEFQALPFHNDGQETFYYKKRAEYNALTSSQKCSPQGSSLFLFLNKTCWRGVYREGPRGFNVPYGHYKNPEIYNKEHLMEIHTLIQGVVFSCMDFEDAIEKEKIKDGDFIYVDPPYMPEKKTSFTQYNASGFPLAKHESLFQALLNTKASFLMSNSDTQEVRNVFACEDNTSHKKKINIENINCRRSIHCQLPNTKAKEVLILGVGLST